jgi:hypothetical protein
MLIEVRVHTAMLRDVNIQSVRVST